MHFKHYFFFFKRGFQKRHTEKILNILFGSFCTVVSRPMLSSSAIDTTNNLPSIIYPMNMCRFPQFTSNNISVLIVSWILAQSKERYSSLRLSASGYWSWFGFYLWISLSVGLTLQHSHPYAPIIPYIRSDLTLRWERNQCADWSSSATTWILTRLFWIFVP